MILTLFLCIKLSILHLCVSDLGYECTRDETRSDPKIFLVENKNNNSHPLNLSFKSLCSNYYKLKTGSLEESKKYTNVIQFAVPNYYYDGKPLDNFVYAGNVSNTDDTECTITHQVEPEYDCHENAKLVSQSLKEIDHGHIHNLVQAIQLDGIANKDDFIKMRKDICEPPFQKPSDLTIVLLCSRGGNYREVNIHPLKLIQIRDNLCYNENWFTREARHLNRLLAVLAPEPLELYFESSVPTIFYEPPYMFLEDKTTFPNSMNLLPWRLLKYGFLKFIQTVGWQRVAIVTDDSEYSIDFEIELTALFSKERLLYTVIRCEDANCEMEKISRELARISARIVIANVEKKHAYSLLRHTPQRITWLLRDMAGNETVQHLHNHQGAFSFSLHNTNSKECPGVENNIITGLSSIAQAYKSLTDRDYNVKKRQFYRLFAEKLKVSTARITEAVVVVNRLHDSERILSMLVKENGENKILNFLDPYKSDKPPKDGTTHCLVTTYDYHKPCGDPVLIFLSFVLLMFVLTILLITCFFEKASPLNDVRYRNF